MKRFFACSAGILSAFILILAVVLPVSAGRGLTVTGVLLVAEVKPGDTLQHEMTVSAGDEAELTHVMVTVETACQAADGTFLPGTGDIGLYSAVPFISIDKGSFTLEGGKPKELTATIRIPQDAGDGGRYAIIKVQSAETNQGNVGINSAVNVPVYLTISGSKIIHTGEISRITTSDPADGRPIEISVDFKNTGNHHFKVCGEVIISGVDGAILETIHLNRGGNSIVPTMTRRLRVTYIPENSLPAGLYSVKARVMLEDGAVLDEAIGAFEIKSAYSPPPPPAEITVMPDSAARLETGDGRISVSFPPGSVIGEARVGLRSYPPEQLPSPPAGYRLAGTSFRLEGINGLLARKATIRVKVSPADLQAAYEDVSRLVLACWDEGSKEWLFPGARVEKNSLTLNAKISQLGIWAVMVRESGHGSIPWAYFGMVTGVASICLLGIFFLSKRKRRE